MQLVVILLPVSYTHLLLKVIAPIMEAQLVETTILNLINHQSLIATKTSRVVYAADGDGIMEFGLRRAQGPDAGLYGARAAIIGGCVGTSNVLAGQLFDVPVMGTHAHSWIMTFPDEYTAFKYYAELYPDNCTLLVDTYDTLKSGVPNADVYKRQCQNCPTHQTVWYICTKLYPPFFKLSHAKPQSKHLIDSKKNCCRICASTGHTC